jgi:hypothetical protein
MNSGYMLKIVPICDLKNTASLPKYEPKLIYKL